MALEAISLQVPKEKSWNGCSGEASTCISIPRRTPEKTAAWMR